MIRRPPRSTQSRSSAASDVYKRQDLKDPAARTRAVDRVVTVYNIAAIYRQAGVPASEYRAVNTEAVAELVWAAARAGARRVVHCSTVGVHLSLIHISEPTRLGMISYAVFCLKKKKKKY